jgi:hypothetical protein
LAATILEGAEMSIRSSLTALSAVAVVAFSGIAGVRSAQAEDVRLRGKVVSLNGPTLWVKTREGTDEAVALKPGWKVTGVATASLADIKPGDFVGIASLPILSGGDGAIEVLVFPEALKHTGEGSYPWDLKPGSTMTNATVVNAVKGIDGHMLRLAFKGGEKTISVPEGIPIVTFAPATEADLKPGAAVFVPAQRDSGGALASAFVVVEAKGVAPPM